MNGKPVALALSFVALLCVGCGSEDGSDAAAQAQTIDVEAFDFYFQEESLLMEPNSSVTVNFHNNGENLHSFTIDDFDIEIEADGGDTQTSTFSVPETPGAYDFYCKYHPDDMQGTISVGGADDPVSETDDQPTDDGDDDAEVEVPNDDGY